MSLTMVDAALNKANDTDLIRHLIATQQCSMDHAVNIHNKACALAAIEACTTLDDLKHVLTWMLRRGLVGKN